MSVSVCVGGGGLKFEHAFSTHLSPALMCLSRAAKVFIHRTTNKFVIYLEGGSEISKNGKLYREKFV